MPEPVAATIRNATAAPDRSTAMPSASSSVDPAMVPLTDTRRASRDSAGWSVITTGWTAPPWPVSTRSDGDAIDSVSCPYRVVMAPCTVTTCPAGTVGKSADAK